MLQTMKPNLIEVGKPVDDISFARFLRSGILPIRMDGAPKYINYDLKFIWKNESGRNRGLYARMYFGKLFRDETLGIENISIDSGVPFKTDSIIAIMNPPSTFLKRYTVKPWHLQHTEGKAPQLNGNCVNNKELLKDFFSAAKAAGYTEIDYPKKPMNSISVYCTLIPYIDKVKNPANYKMYILQIDSVETD